MLVFNLSSEDNVQAVPVSLAASPTTSRGYYGEEVFIPRRLLV